LRLKKELFKNFEELLEKMEKANSQDEAIEFIKSRHPHFAEEIMSGPRSTNASENLHKELEKIRINSGGYFRSEKILFAKWAILIKNLHFKNGFAQTPFSKPTCRASPPLPAYLPVL